MKNKNVLEKLNFYLSGDKINDLLTNKNHSYLMIYDLLKRDYPQFFEYKNYSKSGFIKFMRSAGFTFNLEKYNKQQNWYKLQYRYPKETSIEQLKAIQKQLAQKGQKKLVEIRKKQPLYHPEYGLQHWIDVVGNEHDAKIALEKYKRERSPFCIDFYLKREFTEKQGRKEILKLNCMGALAALKVIQKPKTEEKIKQVLEKNNIEYTHQYRVRLKKDEQAFRKRFYVYDFYIPSKNLLIDCNGTYWHCDPRIYKNTDTVKFPGREKIPVELVWDVDAHRKTIAEKKKYNYSVIWELDLCGDINEKIMGLL